MEGSPPNRCGYIHPPDYEVDDDFVGASCCYRESVPDAELCVWHAHPDQTDHKTIKNLRTARIRTDLRTPSGFFSESLDGAVLVEMELGDALSFENTSLNGANLTEANLRDADLTEANLLNADLTEANLGQADFTEADLAQANLTEANLKNADLTEGNLRGADLTEGNLRGADLTEGNLRGADLTEGNLRGAKLTEADLRFTNLTKADLWNADLTEVDLGSADMNKANMINTDLTGAFLRSAHLNEALLKGSNLTGANLKQADLTGSRLMDTDLCGADFQRATLREVTLPRGDKLREADFTEADLQDQDFRGEELSGATFVKADLTGCDLSRANLSKANLERALLNRADLFDTRLAGAQLEGTVLGNVQVNEGTFERLAPESIENNNQLGIGQRLRTLVQGPTGKEAYRCAYDPASGFDLGDSDGGESVANDIEASSENDERDSQCFDLKDDPEVRAGGVYRQFERLAGENALPEWQRRFFILRQDMQVRQSSGLGYAFAVVQRALFGYGESFGRVIGWSGAIIATFAAIYLTGGWIRPIESGGRLGRPVSWTQLPGEPSVLWESFYYSTLTFTALGFGDFRPVGTIGQLLTVMETASGALLLALLVFVLGRRAAR